MRIKGIKDEVFQDYKKPSMLVAFPTCSWKCGGDYCQNSPLAQSPDIEMDKDKICERYLNNPITEAIIFGGLEPFDSPADMIALIDCLRRQHHCNDDIVIYTGYTKEELERGFSDIGLASGLMESFWKVLHGYDNIIVKFGRYVPNQEKHFDSVLGIELASPNQYAEKLT